MGPRWTQWSHQAVTNERKPWHHWHNEAKSTFLWGLPGLYMPDARVLPSPWGTTEKNVFRHGQGTPGEQNYSHSRTTALDERSCQLHQTQLNNQLCSDERSDHRLWPYGHRVPTEAVSVAHWERQLDQIGLQSEQEVKNWRQKHMQFFRSDLLWRRTIRALAGRALEIDVRTCLHLIGIILQRGKMSSSGDCEWNTECTGPDPGEAPNMVKRGGTEAAGAASTAVALVVARWRGPSRPLLTQDLSLRGGRLHSERLSLQF